MTDVENKDSQTGSPAWPTFSQLKLQVEAILFGAEDALEVGEIRTCIGNASLSEVRLALRELVGEYQGRAFELVEMGNKWQLRTRAEYAEVMKKQYSSKPRSLSKSALETLAIIAYQQPVTRAQINVIRGVDSSSIVATLKDKDLIYISGRRNEVGNPLEYRTTQKFLETFSLSGLKELPSLRSLQMGVEEQRQVVNALASLSGKEIQEPVTPGELSFPDQSVTSREDIGHQDEKPQSARAGASAGENENQGQ